MYTKDSLLEHTKHPAYASMKGLLTTQEAQERVERYGYVMVIADTRHDVFFFTDHYSFGYDVLPDHFVPSRTLLPLSVTLREDLPSGHVTTAEQYIRAFERDRRQLSSLEELADHLNATCKKDHPVGN